MRKYFIKSSYIAVIFSLAFVSCEKFLDTDSPSNFTQEIIYANVSDATKGVSSIYALFNQDAFTSRLSNAFIPNTDIEVGGVGAAPENSPPPALSALAQRLPVKVQTLPTPPQLTNGIHCQPGSWPLMLLRKLTLKPWNLLPSDKL